MSDIPAANPPIDEPTPTPLAPWQGAPSVFCDAFTTIGHRQGFVRIAFAEIHATTGWLMPRADVFLPAEVAAMLVDKLTQILVPSAPVAAEPPEPAPEPEPPA